MALQNSTMLLPPDDNRGPGVLAVGWIQTAIALGFVCARMYCRAVLLRNVGRDDWMMLLAFALAFVTTIFVTLAVYFGVGRHLVYLEPQQITAASKFLWARQPFCTFSACFGKISIAFLLMRLMNRNRLQEICLWFIIVTLLLINTACVVVTFATCSPVWELWQGPHPNPYCANPHIQQSVGYAQAAYSSFTDLVLAIFPYFIIWNLQIDRRLKFYLLGLLSLGIFATAASVVKTIQLKNLGTKDFTWDASDLAYWVLTEDYVIIIAACIPTLRPLFVKSPLLHSALASSPNRGAAGSRQLQYASGKAGALRSRSENSDLSGEEILLKEGSEV